MASKIIQELKPSDFKCPCTNNMHLHSDCIPFPKCAMPIIEKETVNHPAHYGGDTVYEAIKVIEAWQLGFNLGNTVKYIARAGKKGATVEDLKKAAWYLNREIEKLSK